MTRWHETADGYRAWSETDDPRLLAVIERQTDTASNGPDGDAYAPAYWRSFLGGQWRASRAGSTYDDEQAANAYAAALTQYGYRNGGEELAARYMRAFHDTHAMILDSRGNGGGGVLLLLSTPGWREDTGAPDRADAVAALAPDAAVWMAVNDGDVWGVGYAVKPDRLARDEPVDLDDWRVELESWGYYGGEYAREAAREQLPTLEAAGLSEVTDLVRDAVATMAELSARVDRIKASGWWHPGRDHGAGRYADDMAELAAIRDDDGAALSRMYGGGIFTVFDDEDRNELIHNTRVYWGLRPILNPGTGA